MKNLIQRRQRKFDKFSDETQMREVLDLIKSKSKTVKFYTSGVKGRTAVEINEFLPNNNILIVTDTSFVPDEKLTIYGLVNKYTELDLSIQETKTSGYFQCAVDAVRQGSEARRGLRFKVSSDEATVSNFRIDNREIEISEAKIPSIIKVLLEQFRTDNSGIADIFDINIFKRVETDPLLREMKKTGKNVLIQDTGNADSYKVDNDNFINVAAVFGSNLGQYMKANTDKGVKSLMLVPLTYVFEGGADAFSFGYIKLVSRGKQWDFDDVFDVKMKTLNLIERIRSANTQRISAKQSILDVSRDGIRIKITDDSLKNLIPKANGFVFDIVFKFQAPITMYGEIRYTYMDKDSLVVGCHFAGSSSRKDELERFDAILRPMETAYKANLIKKVRAAG